jgi:hypothetical protein
LEQAPSFADDTATGTVQNNTKCLLWIQGDKKSTPIPPSIVISDASKVISPDRALLNPNSTAKITYSGESRSFAYIIFKLYTVEGRDGRPAVGECQYRFHVKGDTIINSEVNTVSSIVLGWKKIQRGREKL